MKSAIKHLLVISFATLACLALVLVFPGTLESFGTRFWDAALWVGGCFS